MSSHRMIGVLHRLKLRILRGWFGQRIWYRYIHPPGAYCALCGRYYTYEEWSYLRTERISPKYIACRTLCVCGSDEWRFVG